MSLRRDLLRFVGEALIAPLVSTIATKVGEAAGDLLAFHVNPPDPDAPSPPPEETDAE